MEEEIKPSNVEVATVSVTSGRFVNYAEDKVEELVKEVNRRKAEEEAALGH